MRRLLSVLLVSGCLLAGLPQVTPAQGTRGFTIFGGPDQELDFYLQSGEANARDRYYLRISKDKLRSEVVKLRIEYPDYYKGKFDTDKVKIKVGEEEVEVPVKSVTWNEEERVITIEPEEALSPDKKIELVLENVKNPWRGGMFYFNCRIVSLRGSSQPQYIGTWVLSID